MSKLLKAILAVVGLYVLVMGGSGLLIRSMLAGGAAESLRTRAQALLPVDVAIEGGDFDIREWFLFRPSISFDGLRVANPKGYSEEALLTAVRIAARAELSKLIGGELAIRSLEIDSPRLLVETAKSGKTNVQALLDALKAKQGGASPGGGEGQQETTRITVESFVLRNGQVRYSTPGAPPLVARNLDVEIRDFTTDGAFPLTVKLDLFDEEAIGFAFEGETGPFTPQSSPASGKLVIDAEPGRLPEAFRRQYMGAFLASPGGGSETHVTLDLKGDLLGTLVGTGALRIAGMQLGDPAVGQLPLSGEAPVLLTLMNPATDPTYDFVMPEAHLKLGAGSWDGGFQVQYDGERVRGQSSGAVSGVDINQMLSAFSDADDLLFGRLELRRYSVKFAGRNAAEIQRSLTGDGRLEIEEGKLAVFDVLRTIEQKVLKAIGSQDSYVQGFTTFVKLHTDLEIAGGRLGTPNLMLENEQASLGAAGHVDFANEDMGLNYSVSSLITGALAAALGGQKNEQGVAQVAAPLRVTGTTATPKVFLDLKLFAKQQAANYAGRVLDSLLKGKQSPAPEAGASPEVAAPAAEAERPRLPFGLGGILDQAIQKAKQKSEPKAP